MDELGLWGIFRESCAVIWQWRRLFGKLVLALVLPLAVLTLVGAHVSADSSARFEWALDYSPFTLAPNSGGDEDGGSAGSGSLVAVFGLVALEICSVSLSLAASAAVTNATARAYIGRFGNGGHTRDGGGDIVSFGSCLRSLRRSLPRLALTALLVFTIVFLYALAAVVLAFASALAFRALHANPNIAVLIVATAASVALAYVLLLWSLAPITPVAEELFCWAAVKRSAALVKGRKWSALAVLLTFSILHTGLWLSTQLVTSSTALHVRIIAGTALVLAWASLYLFNMTVLTLLYIACKQHHGEALDRLPGLNDVKYLEFRTINGGSGGGTQA